MPKQHLIAVDLDDKTVVRGNPDVEHERQIAIYDLLEENRFAPVGDYTGPYRLTLGVIENRLIFDIADDGGTKLGTVRLSLAPFRRIIKDYFTVCESYFSAIKTSTPSQIEAIDMGRRGLHNEGSELLIDRLEGKIEIDFDTARRLFTLICILHFRG